MTALNAGTFQQLSSLYKEPDRQSQMSLADKSIEQVYVKLCQLTELKQ